MYIKIIDKTKDRSPLERCISLRVTHNGFQWASIDVASDSDLRQIRDKINQYLGDK